MEPTQPGQRQISIADSMEWPGHAAPEAAALSDGLRAIHDLIEQAASQLWAAQAKYPAQFSRE